MAEPRLPTPRAVDPKKLVLRDNTVAFEFLNKRGRTNEQIVRLALSIELGRNIALAAEVLFPLRDLLLGDVDKKIAVWREQALNVTSIDPPKYFAMSREMKSLQHLEALRKFDLISAHVITAFEELLAHAHPIIEFFKRNPDALKSFIHWKSRRNMGCALAMYTAEIDGLTPKLQAREIAALMLLIGDDNGLQAEVDDPEATEDRKEAWRSKMRRIEKELLPILRELDWAPLISAGSDSES